MSSPRVCICWLAASIFLAGLTCPVAAEGSGHGYLSFGAIAGFPQGEFKRNVDRAGYGVAGSGGAFPSESLPLSIGLSIAYMVYGSESREEPLSSTIPDVRVDVVTTNSILAAHFLVRLQGWDGPVRPYLDGLAGINYLYTRTRIEDVDDDDEIASSTNLDDGALSYGARAGMMIRVHSGNPSGGEGDEPGGWTPTSVSIDLGVSYMFGREATYLKEGSIRRDAGRVAYDVLESNTDILTAYVGISLSR
ncbi:MAG: hypothetical protein WAW06_12300 [bacterium]